ncbi:hypothetical protein U1Q18_026386 [Sarracenia purpurea var. burkii]
MTNHRKVAEQGIQSKGYGEVICVVRNRGRERSETDRRRKTGQGFQRGEKHGLGFRPGDPRQEWCRGGWRCLLNGLKLVYFKSREKFGFQRDHLLRDGVPSPEVTPDGIDGEHLMESMASVWIFRGDRKGGFQSCEWVFHQSAEG